jgi:hypothetical protein
VLFQKLSGINFTLTNINNADENRKLVICITVKSLNESLTGQIFTQMAETGENP